MKMKKHLSSIANSLLDRCAQSLDTSLDDLVGEFELGLEPDADNYAKKLVEFCSSRALNNLCRDVGEKISDGSVSRLTFDMMLAWETPSSLDEEQFPESVVESVAKEKEGIVEPLKGKGGQVNDDIALFYSDLMPLLVDEEGSVGEDAFAWLGSLFPLVADVVNTRFSFEALTASTANQLYFPAYDRFLKEIDKCITYLQKQATPTGVELADDEYLLHVEGTAKTHRVVRHIGATSWPGRLTLTNQALYFEASAVISYENALKIDLSRTDVDHQVKATSTGPWGAPLFDKAMVYESSQQPEPVILEFPEMTGSTRRDHWLSVTKEVILLHQFLLKFNVSSTLKAWEMQARTILGIIRLHAAREMLRISQPVPRNFLIFTLFDELPKGDYVLEELSSSLKQMSEIHPCSAASILQSFNMSHPTAPCHEAKEGLEFQSSAQPENLESLDTTISQVREEAREVGKAKATVEGIKEEGIAYSLLVLAELLSPLNDVLPEMRGVLTWERPLLTPIVLAVTLVVIYKEWVGYTMATFLLWVVGTMLWTRRQRLVDRPTEIVVSTSTDQTTMESIVSAQHSLENLRLIVQEASIVILKLQSIFLSRAPKHADEVMWAMVGTAIFLALVPFKFVLMALTLCCFVANWRARRASRSTPNDGGNRRLREWWNSIPVVPVRIESDGT